MERSGNSPFDVWANFDLKTQMKRLKNQSIIKAIRLIAASKPADASDVVKVTWTSLQLNQFLKAELKN